MRPLAGNRYLPEQRPSAPLYEVNGVWGAPPAEPDIPAQYWNQIWRAKWIIAGCAVAGVAIGLFLSTVQTPLYRARTSLELQSLNQNYLDMRSIDPVAGNDNLETFLQTQIQLLSSETLVKRAVQQVVEHNPPTVTAPASATPWQFGRAVSGPKQDRTEDAVWYIAGHLVVKGSGLTRLVDIVCESPYPNLAADFANTLASEYIEQNLENRWDSTRKTGEWLNRKVQELKTKLEKAEENLQAYSKSAGLVYTNEKEDVTMEQFRRLEQELSAAHMDRVRKQSRYEQAVNNPVESIPEVMENGDFRDTRSKLIDLRRERAEAVTTMKPEHPKVQKIDAQIAALTAELESGRANVVGRIRSEYEEALRHERMLWTADAQQRRVLGDQLSKETKYNLLKRDVESTRLMYDSMMQKLKEVGVAGAMPVSNVRIVDTASSPDVPALPSRSLNMALGLLFGGLGGLIVGLIRVHADKNLKTPGEAGQLLNVPELGAVPALSCDPVKPGTRIRKWIGLSSEESDPRILQINGGATKKPGGAVDLTMVLRDNSAMAEAYRAALPAILFAHEQANVRKLVITSASPREGKTSSIINLAIGLADLNKRVLLIDGDVRNPRVHEALGLSNQFGFADLLEQSDPDLSSGPIPSGIDRLFVLPVGAATPRTKNLLASARLAQILSAYEAQYDFVLIDTAPALHMRDARMLARAADAVILIVRAGRTSREAASAVIEKFRQDGTAVLGVVLNDWKPSSGNSVYGQDYLKGYRRYYGKA
jgi:capsular exopolysaccharide synthesis family protein